MHGSTMITLHKILEDQLPVGLHIIDNRLPHLEIPYAIASKRRVITKAFNDRVVELLLNRRGSVGQVEPDQSLPYPQRNRQQTKQRAIKLLFREYVRRPNQPPIQAIRPG